MITFDFLKDHPEDISALAKIWYENIGKKWIAGSSVEGCAEKLKECLHDDCMPLTLVAYDRDKPIGMCGLRAQESIRLELSPWIVSFVVTQDYQRKGIGKVLLRKIEAKAYQFGYSKIHLLTFDLTLPKYYQSLGWRSMGIDYLLGFPVTVMEKDLS